MSYLIFDQISYINFLMDNFMIDYYILSNYIIVLYCIVIITNMQDQGNRQNRQQRNTPILFIISIVFLFTLTNKQNSQDTTSNSNIKNQIKDPEKPAPTINQLFSIFQGDQYIGVWQKDIKQQSLLKNSGGKMDMRINKWGTSKDITHGIYLTLNDGIYINEGTLVLWVEVNNQKWETIRNGTQIYLTLKPPVNQTQQKTILHQYDVLLQNKNRSNAELKDYVMKFQYNKASDNIHISLTIDCQLIKTTIYITKEASTILHTIIFSVVLSIIAYLQFSSIMNIYRAAFEGTQSFANYSVTTVLICTLWDAVVCLFSFAQAFSADQSLILFIIPSFIFCFLFINLEMRMIFMIFQANTGNGNIRQLICKFNIVSYGGLIMTYPLVYYTNLSSYFFLAISLLLLPQIWVNGQKGVRPKLNSPYYKYFVPIRFLVVLYLFGDPWNKYELEPNYLLVFSCAGLLISQYFMLWAQSTYGPRKVIPNFLLPKIFNYQCQIDQNVEEGTQMEECSICLTALNIDIPPGQANLNYEAPAKIMKSPCGHKYHGTCLIKWMQIKMECPQCRAKLPPFE